jgi:hypothetical protein
VLKGNIHSLKFYTEVALIFVLLVAFYVSIKRYKDYPLLKLFPYYTCALLVIFINSTFADHVNSDINLILLNQVLSYADHSFTLLELFVFTVFFQNILFSNSAKKILTSLTILFSLYFIYVTFSDKFFPHEISESSQTRAYTIEAVLLLLPCVVYFYELFSRDPTRILANEPAFWIVTGLFSFITCTLPISIMENYIRNQHIHLLLELYSLFHIFYILFFVMLMRAYKCNAQSLAANPETSHIS